MSDRNSIRLDNGWYYSGKGARDWLWRRDGGRCRYCRFALPKPKRSDKGRLIATIDHVEPLSAGGQRMAPDNVVLACERCNRMRGAAPFEDFATFWDNVAGEFTWLRTRLRPSRLGVLRRYDHA